MSKLLSIQELHKKLEKAYEVPSNLLKRQEVYFISTTNPAFRDRVGLKGRIAFSGSVIQFISNEHSRVGSMHTSYVLSISHQEQLTAPDGEPWTKNHNEIIVNTRNSTYTFALSAPDGLGGLPELPEFSWELPKELKEEYEDLLIAYYL